jgi:hypothetical protein
MRATRVVNRWSCDKFSGSERVRELISAIRRLWRKTPDAPLDPGYKARWYSPARA